MESRDSQMEQILDQLGYREGLPVDAIRAADANRAMMVPIFLRAIDQVAAASLSMQGALFIAFHLLGQWREKSAYRPLAAFLHRPAQDVERILGDATTQTSHRVMASVFDGDPNPLYEIILDPAADQFIRARMFAALVIVTLRGELPREETVRFLRSCYPGLQPQGECFVWEGWQEAIAALGMSELKPLVRQAFERGFIRPSWLNFRDFEGDLQRAIDGELQPRQRSDEYQLFGDTIEELSGWAAFAPEDEKTRIPTGVWDRLASESLPAVNRFRGVGRNDPCPCGSGKKFKKCCLGSAQLGEPKSILQGIGPALGWPPEVEPAAVRTNAVIRRYDPLVEPDPQRWLMMDEQQRLDLVLAYHRRMGVGGPRETVHAVIHVVVENQIADDELPVRRTAQRLMSEGLNRHDAIHAIGSVLAGHLNDLMREGDPDDRPRNPRDANEAYFAELEGLTAEDWLRPA